MPVPAEPDQLVSIAKQPVARGYWGKNDAVPTHTTDFLWVNDCFIKSNIPGHEPVKLLDCLVDTASEVVTVKEDISSELNLAFVKTFLSQGIHNAKEQRLYRGILLLGTKEITVDVSIYIEYMENFSAATETTPPESIIINFPVSRS